MSGAHEKSWFQGEAVADVAASSMALAHSQAFSFSQVNILHSESCFCFTSCTTVPSHFEGFVYKLKKWHTIRSPALGCVCAWPRAP